MLLLFPFARVIRSIDTTPDKARMESYKRDSLMLTAQLYMYTSPLIDMAIHQFDPPARPSTGRTSHPTTTHTSRTPMDQPRPLKGGGPNGSTTPTSKPPSIRRYSTTNRSPGNGLRIGVERSEDDLGGYGEDTMSDDGEEEGEGEGDGPSASSGRTMVDPHPHPFNLSSSISVSSASFKPMRAGPSPRMSTCRCSSSNFDDDNDEENDDDDDDNSGRALQYRRRATSDGGEDEEESMELSNTQTSRFSHAVSGENGGERGVSRSRTRSASLGSGRGAATRRRSGTRVDQDEEEQEEGEEEEEEEEEFWSDSEADEMESRPVVHGVSSFPF